jgi:hypothetical protein
MKTRFLVEAVPTLAQRAIELRALQLPGARIHFRGRQLLMEVGISPGLFGRLYECQLTMKPDCAAPDVIVVGPDLGALAQGKRIPHTYAYAGRGTRLCLWWPKAREWVPRMKIADTFLPWTAEWLHYFEVWLQTDEWQGGGEHPDTAPRRWARVSLR